jgi:hypothetical protein
MCACILFFCSIPSSSSSFFAKTKENKNESHIEDGLILTAHRIPSSVVDLSSMKKAVAANSTSAVVEKKKERIEKREREFKAHEEEKKREKV